MTVGIFVFVCLSGFSVYFLVPVSFGCWYLAHTCIMTAIYYFMWWRIRSIFYLCLLHRGIERFYCVYLGDVLLYSLLGCVRHVSNVFVIVFVRLIYHEDIIFTCPYLYILFYLYPCQDSMCTFVIELQWCRSLLMANSYCCVADW